MHCPSCGTAIPVGSTMCPQCRMVFPYNAAGTTLPKSADFLTEAVAEYGPMQETVSRSAQSPKVSPTISHGADLGIPPKKETDYGLQAFSQSQQAPFRSQMTPPIYPNAPLPHVPFPPVQQQPQRSGLSRAMSIFLLVAALVIMFGGITLILYTAVYHPAQLRAQATATVQILQTGTSIANAHATGTAQAYANATATAQALATAQAVATTTALQAIYTNTTRGTPVLSLSLGYPDGSNWDTYKTIDGGGCGFTGSALHASVFKTGYYVPCFAHSTSFSNFTLQVQMTIIKGDGGGLIFRADDINTKFYLLGINHKGTYNLLVSKDPTHNQSIAYDSSTFIKTGTGQTNLLTIIARGSTFYLYINKQFVTTVSDMSYSVGEIGLFASDDNNNTDIAFSNLRVWQL